MTGSELAPAVECVCGIGDGGGKPCRKPLGPILLVDNQLSGHVGTIRNAREELLVMRCPKHGMVAERADVVRAGFEGWRTAHVDAKAPVIAFPHRSPLFRRARRGEIVWPERDA